MVSLSTLFLFLLPLFTNKVQNVSCKLTTDVSSVVQEPESITYTSPDKRLKMIYHPNDLAVRESCECSKCIDSMDVWSILHAKMLESFHASENTLTSMYETTSAVTFSALEKVSAVHRFVLENVSEVIVRMANESAYGIKNLGNHAYNKSTIATSHLHNMTTSLKGWFLARFSADLSDEKDEED